MQLIFLKKFPIKSINDPMMYVKYKGFYIFMVCYTIAQCIKIQSYFDEICYIKIKYIEREGILYITSYSNIWYIHRSQKDNKKLLEKVTKLSATFTPSLTKKTVWKLFHRTKWIRTKFYSMIYCSKVKVIVYTHNNAIHSYTSCVKSILGSTYIHL